MVDIPMEHEINVRSRLHNRILHGTFDEVKMLIAKGADVNEKDAYLWTPLHFAVQEARFDVVSLLLASGADVNAKNGNGNTPLFLSLFSFKKSGDILPALLKAGADPDVRNNFSVSIRELAAQVTNIDFSRYFE